MNFSHKFKFLYVIILVSCCVVSALMCCFRGQDNVSFKPGQIAEGPVEQVEAQVSSARIEIVQPAADADTPAPPRSKVHCEVHFMPRDLKQIPTFMNINLMLKGKKVSVSALNYDQNQSDTAVFSGSIRLPARPGKYQIYVDAIYLVSDKGQTRQVHKLHPGPYIVAQTQ